MISLPRHFRSFGIFATYAWVALVAVACSLASNPSVTVSIDIASLRAAGMGSAGRFALHGKQAPATSTPATTSTGLGSTTAGVSTTPATIAQLDCLALDVTGSGIATDSSYDAFSCSASSAPSATTVPVTTTAPPDLKIGGRDQLLSALPGGVGLLSLAIPVTQSQLTIQVPDGTARSFALLAYASIDGSCEAIPQLMNDPSFGSEGDVYLIGQATADITADTTVQISVDSLQALTPALCPSSLPTPIPSTSPSPGPSPSPSVAASPTPLTVVYPTTVFSFPTGVAVSEAPTVTGDGPFTFAVAPALPAGLTLNAFTGVLSGTPLAASAAQDYAINVTSSDSQASVTLSIGVPDPADLPVTGASTVSATPSNAPADGSTTVMVIVTLADAANNPSAGRLVVLTSSRGALDSVLPTQQLTNATGIAVFTVTSTTSGNSLFTATDSADGLTVSAPNSVHFAGYRPTLTNFPASGISVGIPAPAFSIGLEDASGNLDPLASFGISLSLYTDSLCASANPGPATLLGGNATAISGSANFTALAVSSPGQFYLGGEVGANTFCSPLLLVQAEAAWYGFGTDNSTLASQSGSDGGGVNPGVFSAAYYPGGRWGAATWADPSGNLYVLGGYGLAPDGTVGELADFWEYNPVSFEWAYHVGARTANATGVTGSPDIASPLNYPSARYGATTWTDDAGNFWLYGGYGIDSIENRGPLNDLWEYTGGNWVWKGNSALGIIAITEATVSPAWPGGRVQASGWSDGAGHLLLYGGKGRDTAGTQGLMSDLWSYNISTGLWTDLIPSLANVPTTAGNPGGRQDAITWTDGANGWMYGGNGYDSAGGGGAINLDDLWELDLASGVWSLQGGSLVGGVQPQYGPFGQLGASTPGSRSGAAAWMANGNFFFMGGMGTDVNGTTGQMSDVWEFTPGAGAWTWLTGSSLSGGRSNCGQLNELSPSNAPGAFQDGSAWSLPGMGTTYLFGGLGVDCTGASGNLMTLWQLDY